MNKPIIRILEIDGTYIDREMNKAEFEQYQADQAVYETELALTQAKVEAKSALLEKLGITEDEAKLLLG